MRRTVQHVNVSLSLRLGDGEQQLMRGAIRVPLAEQCFPPLLVAESGYTACPCHALESGPLWNPLGAQPQSGFPLSISSGAYNGTHVHLPVPEQK